MAKNRRLAAILFAALVLLAVAASLCVMACEADHDCIGETCPVCAVIALCRNTLKALGIVLLYAAAAIACVRLAAALNSVCRALSDRETLITLKVLLLN